MLKNLARVHQGNRNCVPVYPLLSFLLHKLLLASVFHLQIRGNEMITSRELAMAESRQRDCPLFWLAYFQRVIEWHFWRMASGTINWHFTHSLCLSPLFVKPRLKTNLGVGAEVPLIIQFNRISKYLELNLTK